MSTASRSFRFVIPVARPRNPLVAAARMRRAGSHGADAKALRRRAAHDLRRELAQLHPPHP
jgi:hypothetical protein